LRSLFLIHFAYIVSCNLTIVKIITSPTKIIESKDKNLSQIAWLYMFANNNYIYNYDGDDILCMAQNNFLIDVRKPF